MPVDASIEAKDFNEYFVDIGRAIMAEIPDTGISTRDLLSKQKNNVSSFFLHEVIEEEVLRVAKSLKSKNSRDLYDHNTIMLKKIVPIIVDQLTVVINECFSAGIFPKCMKIAKVIPIHKKGDEHSIENYRPISKLSALSKILESILKIRLTCYFEKKNIINKSQHGYLSRRSTTTALIHLIEKILEGLENREKTRITNVLRPK